jgi:hypothetical protein
VCSSDLNSTGQEPGLGNCDIQTFMLSSRQNNKQQK